MSEDQKTEVENSEVEETTVEAPKLEKMKTPIPSWIRPITGVFSVCAGLMYGLAALLAAAFYFGATKKFAFFSDAEKQAEIERMAKTQGQTLEEATTFVNNMATSSQVIVEHIGMVFGLFLALFACLAMLMIVSGIGLLLKKVWSLGLARMSYVGLIVAVVVFFVLHHSGFAAVYAGLLEKDFIEGNGSYGLFSSVRLAFLLAMCPAALLMAINLVIKQLEQSEN